MSTLEEFDFSFNDSLDKVKDIFLWSCYTGLRFTDAQSLTTKNINKDTKGDIWLAIEQQKTKEPLTIPLIDKAIGIYEKYSQSREITGFILPRLVNQKVNAYLKIIADLTEINKKLTHHIARHTFAHNELRPHKGIMQLPCFLISAKEDLNILLVVRTQ